MTKEQEINKITKKLKLVKSGKFRATKQEIEKLESRIVKLGGTLVETE